MFFIFTVKIDLFGAVFDHFGAFRDGHLHDVKGQNEQTSMTLQVLIYQCLRGR